MGKGGKHVVAVAAPDHLLARNRAAMFLEGHDVGHDLTGMGAVGQPVDHRHGGVLGHLQQHFFLKGADHDEVDVAAEHAGGVGDGLAMAKLHFRAAEHHGLPAHLPHAQIEGHARAGGGFLKDQCDHVACERQFRIGRPFGQARARRFHLDRVVDDVAQVAGVCFMDVEEMAHGVTLLAGGRNEGRCPSRSPRYLESKEGRATPLRRALQARWRRRRGGRGLR